MKPLLTLAAISIVLTGCTRSHRVTITDSVTDERGLTSVIFTQDGQEYALDYLTKNELDSLKAIR